MRRRAGFSKCRSHSTTFQMASRWEWYDASRERKLREGPFSEGNMLSNAKFDAEAREGAVYSGVLLDVAHDWGKGSRGQCTIRQRFGADTRRHSTDEQFRRSIGDHPDPPEAVLSTPPG